MVIGAGGDVFVDFAEAKNNTIHDLIDGFKHGMNGGNSYDHYKETHVGSWDDVIWGNLSK